MKFPFAAIMAAVFSLPLISQADTNVALTSNGGTAIFGYNNGSTLVLGTQYDHAGNAGNLNDGQTTTGGGDDSFGQPNPSNGYVGAEFTLSPTMQVNSVVFYGHNFVDGGWFGFNGIGPLGAQDANHEPTLTAANLIVPTLQFTTDGGQTWVNDTLVTNDYISAFTGTEAANGAPTNPATFTLTVPLTGIDGIRLIGEDGGTASGGGGFLGADEFQVFAGAAVPEPSTWALMLGGVATLLFCTRLRFARA
jgi:hypothetical protein